jgi:hypothetical protein
VTPSDRRRDPRMGLSVPVHVPRLNLQFPDAAGFERLLHAAGAPPLPTDEGS